MSLEENGKMDSSTGAHIGSTQRPTAKYSKLTNSLRVLTTGSMQCSMFCGGKGCKYDNPSKWSEDQMAIKGLFSHWVTKRILAMSRPSTDAVKKYDIIGQFKEHGIKAVINLQTPGEHAHCGLGLEPGGFSYDQEQFMDNDIFFYNFGWDDYGVKSLTFILDMVKVMTFAIKEGKVAVHCHAGLGRTGVLIACYLIYAKRFDGDHAIHFVREKRPGSIQTKGQVECCQQFAQFLIPLRVVFSSCDPCSFPFTLQQFLNRQKHLLHGSESRELKHIPKIVKIVCVRLHQLAKIKDVHSSSIIDKRPIQPQFAEMKPRISDSLLCYQLRHNLNQSHSAWKILATEEDPFVLAALMWSWLEHLKEPVLQGNDMEKLVEYSGDLLKSLTVLEKMQKLTVDCILQTTGPKTDIRLCGSLYTVLFQQSPIDIMMITRDFLKFKKKKEKSPRKEEVIFKKQERENDQRSSDDEEPLTFAVPKKRGNALPPIF
nr:protein tyrosine phosphatase domain-containing protein 1-like [Lytechinus pictus]